jgi:hypothetical protein
MYVYMSEGWFHSFGVFGFWLVGGFGVCGPQVCWLQKQDGCTYGFTFALRSITVGDVSSLEEDSLEKEKKRKKKSSCSGRTHYEWFSRTAQQVLADHEVHLQV